MGAIIGEAKRIRMVILVAAIVVLGGLFAMAGVASAAVVSGPDIIPAPASAEDSAPGAFNTHQQAFDERQGVVLPVTVGTDNGTIPAGTRVNSHMIFLNQQDGVTTALSDISKVWTFDGPIIGVMSDFGGTLEAASNAILGHPGTIYPGAFAARGLESGTQDGYTVAGNTITVSMRVTQPGDWIRVVTAVSVGGTTSFLTESSGSSVGGTVVFASTAAAFAMIMGGGWYARRRWFGTGTG